jgi:cytochrome P450
MPARTVPPYKINLFMQLQFVWRLRQDTLKVFRDLAAEADIVRFKGKNISQYLLFHPDLYQDVLVTHNASFKKDISYTDPDYGLARFLGNGLIISEGEFWKRQRKLAQPAFHVKRIDAYADTMVEYTLKLLDEWQSDSLRDIDRDMMALTLKIVARTLFDVEMASEVERIAHAMEVLQHLSDLMRRRWLPKWLRGDKPDEVTLARQDLDRIVYRLIRERRESGEDRGDLLSMLLQARDDEGRGMSDEQARDEAVTIILAGHETTANALNWTWVLLAQHPEVEAKLHAELDTVLNGEPPTLADLKRLPYTEMVVKESMRLYPPAYSYGRQAKADVVVGDYQIQQGDILTMFSYIIHRDPRWWDDPHAFKPERWTEEHPHRHKYAYLPFGGGPRVCIGNSFAMMEACLILATIASRYRISLIPGEKIQPQPLITLRPKNGLKMRVADRRVSPVRSLL